MDVLDFHGRQALVIGGSTGIGNASAQLFRQHGAAVHVTGTRRGPEDYSAEDVSDLSGLGYSQLDLQSREALAEWRPPFERLDTLVLCHALTKWNGAEYDADAFRQVVEVNLNSVFDCAQRFRPMLADSKGSIIIVSSLSAFRTIPDQPAYTASKSALLGLTRALSMEYIKQGVRVNGVAPGLVVTKMGRGHHDIGSLIEKTVRRIPIKRTAAPEEMAGPILYLASPLASYVIGQTLIVDGGMSLTS
jgi:3-oxoacyl-[acyl-carrier protein] reductase